MLKSLMSVAVAALAFTSCSKDATEDVMPNGGTKTLEVTASIDQTRTVMAADHVNLDWTDNDQIYLYIGENATQKTDAHVINAKSGGKITGVTYENGKTVVYANYSEGNSYSTGVKSAEIYVMGAQEQSKASEFAGKYLPMVAKGTITNGTVNLVFQPVGCVLVFNVYGQGKTAGEKLKSIKITTDVDCCGYKMCDLTAETLDYVPTKNNGTSATVTLTTAANIDASKPSDTKVNENQVYLVVAPFNYEAATFTVTTDAGNTYTFKTANGIDCKTNTARVVNLNLAKAAEFKPEIIVPTHVDEQSSEAKNGLLIEGIQFKNLSAEQIGNATIHIYSNADLSQNADWLKINNTAELSTNGRLYYNLEANTDVASRTAYIVIECAGVKSSAIAITQVGKDSKPSKTVTYIPMNEGYTNSLAVDEASLNNVSLAFTNAKYYDSGKALRCYAGSKITVKSFDKISKIVINRGEDDGNKTLSADAGIGTGTMSGDTWTGESNEVVLTVETGNGNLRLASMEITYLEGTGGGEKPQPAIKVPSVDQQPAAGGEFPIQGIEFMNIDDVANVTAGVYSDKELANTLTSSWLTIVNPDLANGTLSCDVTANETTEERTAYIGIIYGDIKAAIAVTQAGKTDPGVIFVEHFDGLSGNNTTDSGSNSAWSISSKFSASTNVYQAGGAIRIGTSKKTGSITTQKLDLSAPTTLQFKVKGWSSSGSIDIYVGNTKIQTVNYSATMTGDFEQKTVQLEAATSTSTIKIATTSGSKRAFIDDIIVKVTE